MSKGTVTVTVMSALPSAHEFNLPNGKPLTIQGRPESLFVGENGLPLQGNQYGETPGVLKEDWDYVLATYGEMEIFKHEIMFAAADKEEKKARKKSNKDVRTGLEQIDPVNDTRTTPADKEEA